MSVWLVLNSLNRDAYKDIIQISKAEYTIGRGEACDLALTQQKRISGVHCKFFKSEGSVYVEDLSSNGTYHNGVKIGTSKKAKLSSGDEVSLIVPSAELAKKKGGDISKTFLSFLVNIPNLDVVQDDITNDYAVIKQIGEGNFAVVKLGVSKKTSEKVALKIIDKKKFAESAQALRPDQLDDEINIMKKVKHPYLLSVIEVYESEKEIVLVLELAEQGDLFDSIVEKGHYKEDEARDVFGQLCSAVHFLHQSEIVHRDLKPENILLSKNGIKVSDFGLSKIIGEDQMAKTLCGTPQYLAPEVIFLSERRTTGGYGKEVDIWSMGVILFVLLAGYPPFEENKFSDIKKARFNFNQKVWKTVSEEAKDLIQKILVVDPRARFTIPQIFNHPWMKGMEKYQDLASLSTHKPIKTRSKDDSNPSALKRSKPDNE